MGRSGCRTRPSTSAAAHPPSLVTTASSPAPHPRPRGGRFTLGFILESKKIQAPWTSIRVLGVGISPTCRPLRRSGGFRAQASARAGSCQDSSRSARLGWSRIEPRMMEGIFGGLSPYHSRGRSLGRASPTAMVKRLSVPGSCTASSRGRLTGPQGCEAAIHAWWRRAALPGQRDASGLGLVLPLGCRPATRRPTATATATRVNGGGRRRAAAPEAPGSKTPANGSELRKQSLKIGVTGPQGLTPLLRARQQRSRYLGAAWVLRQMCRWSRPRARSGEWALGAGHRGLEPNVLLTAAASANVTAEAVHASWPAGWHGGPSRAARCE
jgi:hypothetical protein